MDVLVPALEIGGTHVSAAAVTPAWEVARTARLPLDADASASELVDTFAAAAAALDLPAAPVWGVAMPDPFDYRTGVALFEGVGKFGALHGVDLGAALRGRLGADVVFLNDADAFVLGEWAAGGADGAADSDDRAPERCAGLTLGTGIGSGWLADGRVVDPGDPPGGRIHRVTVDGHPLEDAVSRRAVRRRYAERGGDADADVREIAGLARTGDARARAVLDDAYRTLGSVVGPRVRAFGAQVLLVGGSIAGSWDVLEPAFLEGAGAGAGAALPPVRVVADSDRSALIGAAVHAVGLGPR